MIANKMDLHTHSHFSDGELSPTELVLRAKESGIGMLALSDHDSMGGVPEVMEAGRTYGLTVVPAVEFDTEFPQEMHILGYCVDGDEAGIKEGLRQCIERRDARNEEMIKKLYAAGYDIRRYIEASHGTVTRANFAAALTEAGYVPDFKTGLALVKEGGPGYVQAVRHSPQHVIELILGAGGLPVLAHPCHLNGNVHAIVRELVGFGLKGIEAYYGTATPGQTARDVSLAAQHGLFISCGSDFHGEGRLHSGLGCAWQNVPALEQTRQMLLKRLGE